MSSLVLIRHGQASFLAEDYDELSDLGRRQARLLGEYLVANAIRIDAVYTGPRKRHLDTMGGVRQVCVEAGWNWPDAKIVSELDEHQVDQLVLQHRDELRRASPLLSSLVDAFEIATIPTERHRSFQLLFEAAAELWLSRDRELVESFPDFHRRVNRVIDQMIAASNAGERIAVFTSVGPISIATQRALECTPRKAMHTGWRIKNCSLTQIVFSGTRFTLDSFNNLPHLDPESWTYR